MPYDTLQERSTAEHGHQSSSSQDLGQGFDQERARRVSNAGLREYAAEQGVSSTSATSTGTKAHSPNPFEPAATAKNQSRAGEPAFAFEPATLTFSGAGTEEVAIKNTTSEPQTIDGWHLAGDSSAFETTFVGARSVVLQPGESFRFRVRFVSEREMPQAAALLIDSVFASPARLNIVGVKQGAQPAEGCSTVPISGKTPEGRSNSIQSAMRSVEGAWSSMLGKQKEALGDVKGISGEPKEAPAWKSKLDGVIAQGLSKVIGGIGLYLGGGLALAAWNALEGMGIGREEAAAGAKEVSALTLKLHELMVGSYAEGALTKAAQAVREAVEGKIDGKKTSVSAAMRDAFFDAQSNALSAAYENALTTLNNSEGDFAALEARHPGLGFAALEAYRSHISCHKGNVQALQRSATVGMWMSFLAQLDLGTHEPEKWEHAKPGAAVEKDLYNSTDAHHHMRDLARGVLELHVIWDYDHMKSRPVYSLEHARVSGISAEMKEHLTRGPLANFPLPIIVHGKVKHDTPTGTRSASHLRIGRNEGGAISLGAEPKTKGAEMLELLGNGDAFSGARALFQHIDQLTLAKVE